MEIYDLDRNLRATISDDGEVKNAKGELIAFVNEDGSAGDTNEAMLGEVNNGQVLNAADDILGSVDQGRGLLRKGQGMWAEIVPGGEIRDKNEAYRGKIDNFTFHKFLRIVGYLYFVDQQLIQDDLPSLLGAGTVVTPKPTVHVLLTVSRFLTYTIRNLQKRFHCLCHLNSLKFTPKPLPSLSHKNNQKSIPKLLPSLSHKNRKKKLNLFNYQHQNPNLRLQSLLLKNETMNSTGFNHLKGIEGGTKNTLEITSCDAPIAQLSVRIEKGGKDLVFKRTIMEGNQQKEQVQHFGLPYVVTLDRIKATYAPNEQNGKLTFLLTKPIGNVPQGTSGPDAGEFCRFVVPATPGTDPTNKVAMASTQTMDSFIFSPKGESKWDSEIVGELANDGQALKFHCTVTVVEEKTKKKATQTITLPMKITLANIQTEGSKVTVFKTKTVQQASAPAPIPTAETVPDCDIKIEIV